MLVGARITQGSLSPCVVTGLQGDELAAGWVLLRGAAQASSQQRSLLESDSELGLASPQQEFQGQEVEAVSLLKQGPEIDAMSHPLLDEATRAAHNGEGETNVFGS